MLNYCFIEAELVIKEYKCYLRFEINLPKSGEVYSKNNPLQDYSYRGF